MFRPCAVAMAIALACLPLLAAASPLTLGEAVDRAVEHSEATRAATAGALGAIEMARAAGERPDPVLRAGIDNLPVTGADRFRPDRDSMTMKRVGISQEWVSAEKRDARRAEAEAEVDRQRTEVRIAAAEVRLQTALAYVDAWFAGESLRSVVLAERIAQESAASATARLAAASAAVPDALALAGARGIAEDDAAELRQQQAAAQVALDRWTGVATETAPPLAIPSILDEPMFVARHPQVRAGIREAESARRQAAVAAGERHPNWTWELSYGQRTGYSDMVSFGVSIPLAIAPDARQDRTLAAKLRQVDRAEAKTAEAARAATAEFRTLASDVQRLADRIARWEASVVMPARQRAVAALAAYGANQGTLATVFDARRAEVDAARRGLSLRRELARVQVRLAFAPLRDGDEP